MKKRMAHNVKIKQLDSTILRLIIPTYYHNFPHGIRMANPLWFIIWLVILVIVAFPVAFFCAGWYVVLYPLTVCIPAISVSVFEFGADGGSLLEYYYIIVFSMQFEYTGSDGFLAAWYTVHPLFGPIHDGVQIIVLNGWIRWMGMKL